MCFLSTNNPSTTHHYFRSIKTEHNTVPYSKSMQRPLFLTFFSRNHMLASGACWSGDEQNNLPLNTHDDETNNVRMRPNSLRLTGAMAHWHNYLVFLVTDLKKRLEYMSARPTQVGLWTPLSSSSSLIKFAQPRKRQSASSESISRRRFAVWTSIWKYMMWLSWF